MPQSTVAIFARVVRCVRSLSGVPLSHIGSVLPRRATACELASSAVSQCVDFIDFRCGRVARTTSFVTVVLGALVPKQPKRRE